jgi:hypothetical protein
MMMIENRLAIPAAVFTSSYVKRKKIKEHSTSPSKRIRVSMPL